MKKLLVLGLVVALVVTAFSPALAGKKGKKKGPKPYKSEEVDVAMGHGGGYLAGVGLVRTPFELECAIPDTQGSDAYIFEVPEQYRKIQATVSSFGSNGDYDLDIWTYDESCALTGQFDSATEDEIGFIGPGTFYILVANFRASPATVRIELAPPEPLSF